MPARVFDDVVKKIRSGARPAVLWTRSAIPTSGGESTSYFGGLPRLPQTLDWPRLKLKRPENGRRYTGSPTFLGQIDFADIAAFARAQRLPAQGVLYFFCDTCFVDGDPAFRVLFAPEGCADYPERRPPDDLMRLAAAAYCSGRDWRGNDEAYSKVDFRHALTPHMFNCYKAWRDLDIDERRYRETHDQVQIAALEEVFGPLTPVELPDHAEWADNKGWPRLLFPSWPMSRLFFTEFDRALTLELKGGGMFGRATLPRGPLAQTFHKQVKADLARWRTELGSYDDMALLPHEVRQAIREWFVATRARARDLTYGVGSASEKADVVPPWDFARVRDESMWLAANITVAGGAAPGGLDGGSLRAALSERVESWTRPVYSIDPARRVGMRDISRPLHQTLGYGECCQSAAEHHINDVLLLQITPADCLGWQGRFSSILLQFWINPEDLAARRFDRVELTTECD